MMWFCDDMMKTPNGIIPGSTPGESLTRHLRIHIMGIVQGVGFRPFVYTLAKELGLSGNVANSGNGVIIHLSGSSTIIDTFLDTLKTSPPPLAHISEISITECTPKQATRNLQDFSIETSNDSGAKSTLISPDIASCDDCINDIFSPANRRLHYPFTNCTNCGPR
jgi:hydrogenase maturation protein HypF